MKAVQKRNIGRWIHLITGSIIATFIYSPWGTDYYFAVIVKFLIIPVLIGTGLWLWKGHLLRRK
jgi:uncharacterized membrane protein YeaQ/YmgE (transglycosylase-associated protein family)